MYISKRWLLPPIFFKTPVTPLSCSHAMRPRDDKKLRRYGTNPRQQSENPGVYVKLCKPKGAV